MIKLLESLINVYVAGYLALVLGTQLLLAVLASRRRARLRRRRRAQGLDDAVLIDHREKLSQLRREAVTPAVALAITVFGGPALMISLAHFFGQPMSVEEQEGLAFLLIGLLFWLVWSGTDLAKSFLSGLAFKTLVAVKRPLQVGDRVTVRGHTGTVTDIGIFYLTLRVGGGDQVSVPMQKLWSEVLVSKNAGQRSSLSEKTYQISSSATREQRQTAEDAVWEAMQASPYLDPSQPLRIYIGQKGHHTTFTARAFVAATANQALFESDVARAFLDRCAAEGIPLG